MDEVRHRGVAVAITRIRLIAGQTVAEALRMRLTALLVAVAALLLLGSRWLQSLNFGAAEIPFLADLGLGIIGLLGTFFAVLATAHLFFNNLPTAAVYILTRPVRRWEYIAGKLTGVAGLLALFTAALAGWLGVLIVWRSHQLGVSAAGLAEFLNAGALLWMKFTIAAAMTLAVCAYAGSALFATCAGLLLVAIGHLRPFAEDGLEWLRVWPNLALFDPSGMIAGARPPVGKALAQLAGYWAMSCAWLGTIAAYVFRHREF